ncbi:MAG TPA: ATP-dependent DNA helicase [Kineosporiaceae bacterium]|nr:ATP-dependent DNA helicase [Kineosporiaceae bacterium]
MEQRPRPADGAHGEPGDGPDGEPGDGPDREPGDGPDREPSAPDVVGDLLAVAVRSIGGVPRQGQQAMAAAVAQAVGRGEHLLVQAGTGTGKSLAYLVPAIAHAMATGRPVVVSTATLALQAQIVDRELPRIAHALAPLLGRRPTWQLVKGRRNYVCRHKLVGGFPADDDVLFDLRSTADPADPADPAGAAGTAPSTSVPTPVSPLGREVARLREWALETASGDRDELVPGVGDRAWRQVSVSAQECLGGQRCPHAANCFSELARERAHEADVVVTNHAFVAIDTFEGRRMLPEHDLLVLDEGHEFADRVTSVISDELTEGIVDAASRRVRQAGLRGQDRLDDAVAVLAAALAEAPEGRFALGIPEDLASASALLRDAAREVLSALSAQAPKPGADGARQAARAAVSEIHEVAERLAGGSAAPQGPDVAWVSRYRRPDGGTRVGVHIAPLSVAGLLRQRLYEDRTVVLTSATLTLGGTFDVAAGSVGLLGEDAPAWRGVDVGSPFDYPRQGVLYLARHLPPPGREGVSAAVLDELAALVEAAGGRTLGLFSSRRAAEIAAEDLRERLDVPVLCQGDDTTPTLVREFARDARTCLFGTLSLWQGVDVPGSACQLVVIDRIPFPRPDDPLSAARQQAVARSGGNGFMAVAASHAALRLAQGVGRLVRSAGDRGVVAVLDSRLATARYGGFLRASLPPFWTTDARQAVLDALRRIDAAAPDPIPVREAASRAGEAAFAG